MRPSGSPTHPWVCRDPSGQPELPLCAGGAACGFRAWVSRLGSAVGHHCPQTHHRSAVFPKTSSAHVAVNPKFAICPRCCGPACTLLLVLEARLGGLGRHGGLRPDAAGAETALRRDGAMAMGPHGVRGGDQDEVWAGEGPLSQSPGPSPARTGTCWLPSTRLGAGT